MTTPEDELGPEELGCLVGGPLRATEVALASLLLQGLVRTSRTGLLSAVHEPYGTPGTALEAQLLTRLRTGRNLTGALASAARSAAAEDLRSSLRDRGLLRQRRRERPRLYPWLALLGTAVLAAGFLDWLRPALVSAVIGAALLAWSVPLWVLDPGPLLTAAGRRALDLARRNLLPEDRVRKVALHGLRGRSGGVAVGSMFGLSAVALGSLPGRADVPDSCGSGHCSSRPSVKADAGSAGGGGTDGCGDGGCGCGE